MENKIDQYWETVKGNIMTRWAEKVDPQRVLPEYPRPQMVRSEWINLNGLWDYAVKGLSEKAVTQYDGKILVPFPVESALSGVKKPLLPEEALWYRRTFIIPEEWNKKRLLLHFGAADWKTEVWINKKYAGEHTGGYYPFTFDISEYLKSGDNEIVVCVWDSTDSQGYERGKQTLKPGGIFYTPSSGIWQTVWIEPVPINYIKSLRLTPDIDNEEISIEVEAGGDCKKILFEAEIFNKDNKIVTGKTAVGDSLKLKILNPLLWSPESPFLYDVKIKLIEENEIVDEVISYFGMRKFSIGMDKSGIKRLFLNNRPLFQNGVLDQGFWPDGLYTAPTDEALEYDIVMAKQLGFNMIRKHIKVEPARWYYHCDRLGIIVWQDMINGGGEMNIFRHVILPNIESTIRDNKYKASGRSDKSGRDNYKKELKEMMDTLYNTPCIGMWVLFNEAWGQFDAEENLSWAGKYDPTRWIDHASGWYDQEAGDIKSVHTYFKKLRIPRKIKGRALIISEYGGYSLHEIGHVWDENKEFGYKKFSTSEELQKAYFSLINNEVEPLIGKGVSAVVYTQLTDVETEINGMLTYDREIVKMDLGQIKKLNRKLYSKD